VTLPAGIAASRLKGAAIDRTGSDSSGVPASAAFTASACTWLMKSIAAVSSNRAVAADMATVQVPMTELT